MSYHPVLEQIAQKVRQRLKLLSAGNGYNTTASGVIRPTALGGFSPDDYQIVFIQGESTKNQELSCPGNPPSVARNQQFLIRAEILPSKKDDRPLDQIRNRFAADVEKALTTSQTGNDWAQWDGLAVNSMIGDATPYLEDDTTIAGFEMNLIVVYRVSENDPYQVRA